VTPSGSQGHQLSPSVFECASVTPEDEDRPRGLSFESQETFSLARFEERRSSLVQHAPVVSSTRDMYVGCRVGRVVG
jgi:hypothetical protein